MGGSKPTKRRSKSGENCCPLMEMALDRVRPADRTGLQRASFYVAGQFVKWPVILFHKSKDRKGPLANATYGVVNYCPFCGTKLEQS